MIEYSSNAQYQYLGLLIMNPKLIDMTVMSGEYFLTPVRELFEAMVYCWKEKKAIIAEDLIAKGVNLELYMSIMDCYIPYADLKHQAIELQMTILESYKKRSIINIAKELSANLITYDEAQKQIENLEKLNVLEEARVTEKRIMDSLTSTKQDIQFLRFKKLRAILRMKEHDFAVIAGATGKGKSALALNLLDDLSKGYRCLFFNMEMVEEELYHRLIGINTSIPINEIQSYNTITGNKKDLITNCAKVIAGRNIEVISESQTLNRLKSKIIKSCNDKDHLIVFIDHIGLIGTKGNAYERMTEIAKELRKISLDYNCTIFGLCQLNREAQKGDSKPSLSSLRDSGEIEQSASKVIMIHSEAVKDGFGNTKENYKVFVLKNRGGYTGEFSINYDKSTQCISEI